MVRGEDGRPWFIHGVGFDITDSRRRRPRCRRSGTCCRCCWTPWARWWSCSTRRARSSGSTARASNSAATRFDEVRGRHFWDMFPAPEEAERCRTLLQALRPGERHEGYEGDWIARDGTRRRIAWSNTALPAAGQAGSHIITTGIDITERKRMERALLEISAREQRQIGQDLHDGLGQHLTGIAFMSKVLAQQLGRRRHGAGRAGAEDRAAGERGDQQDPRAGPRAAAGILGGRRPDVGPQAVGGRGRGPVPHLLRVRRARSRS